MKLVMAENVQATIISAQLNHTDNALVTICIGTTPVETGEMLTNIARTDVAEMRAKTT